MRKPARKQGRYIQLDSIALAYALACALGARSPCLFTLAFLPVLFGTVLAFSQSPAPDLIITNADIRTMDKANPRAEAVAIVRDRIVAVGASGDIAKLAVKNTKIIDAKGRLVLPGFNDAHAHFMAIGNLFSSIDLSDAKNEAAVIARLKHFARFLPKGRWILGGKLDPAIAVSRLSVDAATPDHPTFVYHNDAKTAFANGVAMRLARIEAANGIVDAKGIASIRSVVPSDHVRDWPAMAETASNYAASLGVTSIQDTHSDDMFAVYRSLAMQGRLKTRIYDCVQMSNWAKLAAVGTKAAEGNAMVRTGCVKGYYDPDDQSNTSLAKNVAGADKAGLQVLIHAIGTDSNAAVLSAFEAAINANGPRDRRFRIEHAHLIASRDFSRFARSGIIPSMQPILFFDGASGTADDYRKLLDSGAAIAFGADAPMRGFNPLEGIHAAVNAGGKRGLSVEEAVYAYTMGAAYAEFQEEEKGSITVGKMADLVVISGDLFALGPNGINKIEALFTIAGGIVVYASI